jgi:phenylpyruvate tautomerase PptA (4-oxalocrotonate tautomerase family)
LRSGTIDLANVRLTLQYLEGVIRPAREGVQITTLLRNIVSEKLNILEKNITVLLDEIPRTNFSVNGILVCDLE